MQAKQNVNLKDYKELIDTIAKVEYQKMSTSAHLIEFLELVNIGNHTVHILFKNNPPEKFNKAYLSTAIKWAIRNEVRRRYKWYSLKNKRQDSPDDLREAVYRTILSIDEMADAENPTQIRDDGRNPEEFLEFSQMKVKIMEVLKTLPPRERDLIENKFFKDKKLRELTEEFGVSPSRISRIIQSGLNKIKKELAKQDMI